MDEPPETTTLPAGVITFLFTDIEGSTPLWEQDPAGMRLSLQQHNHLLQQAIAENAGHLFKTIGDEYQAAFTNPQDAVAAALQAQRSLITATWGSTGPLKVRMGLHLGHVQVEGNDYVTTHTLNRVARIMDAAHGGQILLSGEVAGLVRSELPSPVTLLDLGQRHLKGLREQEHLFQVQAPDLPATFPPLRTLGSDSRISGRYERQTLIGQGAMGTVYRGLDTVSGQPVAIKALRPEVVAKSPDLLTRFQQEGEALRRLNHPNIVKMLDMVMANEQHYLVLEYVSGGDLHTLLAEKRPLPLNQILNLALDLADALTRAHRLNIIHRDMKPSNVLLAEDGTPRLSDFGIAKIGDQSALTQSGMLLGTLAYLSPEACQGQTLDERADIWSFGVLLYETLVGQRPFVGDSIASLLVNILNQPLPDIAALRADVPDALQDLLYRMLTKERLARIPTVRLVGVELEAILQGFDLTPAQTGHQASQRFVETKPPTANHNLPGQTTPFVGREAERVELQQMLNQSDIRLVTILGTGGMGKTRLALATAEELLEAFADGVYFVELAKLQEVATIVPAVAEAVGFSFYQSQLTPQEQLLNYLRSKEMLLLLDNFEHLLAGVSLVTDILQAAPDSTLLATSRVKLGLQAEHLFHLSGMDFPDWETPEDAQEYSAVKLFLQSARRVRPGYELAAADLPYIARICRLTQGMPLAILLAAAWLELLTPQEIADEISQSFDFLETDLQDVPARQQSIRVAFDYAWGLLTNEEQAVFAALSIFRGGFTRQAAQQITGASLKTLISLVNKSLLQRSPSGRFQIHELLRQYAAQQLGQNPAKYERLRDKHSAYYCAALQQIERQWKGSQEKEAMAAIEVDFENVRRAWNWSAEHGHIEQLAQALDSLGTFYLWLAWIREAETVFGKALNQLDSHKTIGAEAVLKTTKMKIQLLIRHGLVQVLLGNLDEAARLYQNSGKLIQQLEQLAYDCRREKAMLFNHQGHLAWIGHDRFEESKSYLEQSLLLAQELKDDWQIASIKNNLGWANSRLGNYLSAKKWFTESLALYSAWGNKAFAFGAMAGLADTLGTLGFLDESIRYHRENLAINRELGRQYQVFVCLSNLSWNLIDQGEFVEAYAIAEEGLEISLQIGSGLTSLLREHIAFALIHLGQYQEAYSQGEKVLGHSIDSDASYALCCLGMVAMVKQNYSEAQHLLTKSVASFRDAKYLEGAGRAASLLGLTYQKTNQLGKARLSYVEALRIIADTHSFALLIRVLSAAPLYLVATGLLERAVELYVLAMTLPYMANSQWWADVVGKEMEAAAASLPPDVRAAAQKRGQSLDLWETAERLLQDLES